MTTPAATSANGTTLKFGASASPTQVLGQITNFKGPTGSMTILNATNLASTAKEKLPGLPDEGSLTLDINLDPADTTGHVALRAARESRTLQYFVITYTGGTHTDSFTGYVTGFAVSGGVDAILTAQVTIEITGPVVSA